MSKLLLDPDDYERFTGRNFEEDHILPQLRREAEQQERRCAYCGKHNPFTLDHIIPRVQGGSDDPSNLIWACLPCNSKKGGRTPDQANMPIRFIKEAEYIP